MNYAINMQRSKFYKCSSLYFDNDMSQSGFLTESQSFAQHYELTQVKLLTLRGLMTSL